MYKSRRSGTGKSWGGESGSAGARGKRGGDKKPGLTNDETNPLSLPVMGAVVTAIESHPKKPHMYRIVLMLELDEFATGNIASGEAGLEFAGANDQSDAEQLAIDWTDEVDSLIAGAQSARGAGEATLTVHEDTLVSWRLLKGRRLTAKEYETLKQDEQKEDAYRSALMMLERKARTTSELTKALKSKGYVPEVVEACLVRLRAGRMIDDTAYAKRFTEQRAVGQRKGRMLIRQELLQRGVGREDVDQAIGELDGEVEQESALAIARKRWPNIKGNDRERKQKLMAVLLRRGFPSGVVRMAVQQASAESEDSESESDYGEFDPYDTEYMED
ncbi:regulatory protein RecX [Cohnella lupini]|uniref:Regulatory protein RecX n=1 Tax=Cohnella lupini TaxID=1294267 RepID=A0A3D9IW92_9BACL|nr:regulatory protein RecX [Cohnella lupini]RED66103.1 SOS response regulatory protein OraA/RecX [Cohnella lupini]